MWCTFIRLQAKAYKFVGEAQQAQKQFECRYKGATASGSTNFAVVYTYAILIAKLSDLDKDTHFNIIPNIIKTN